MSDQYAITLEDGSTPSDLSPYRCETCGEPLNYGGRGRKPRFCAEHKKNSSSGSKKISKNSAQLEESLADGYRTVGSLIMMVNEGDGMEIMARADRCAHAIVTMAENNPAMMKWVTRTSGVGGWFGVVSVHAGLAGAIMVNHGVTLPKLLGREKATH